MLVNLVTGVVLAMFAPPGQGVRWPESATARVSESATAAPGPISKNVASNDINFLGKIEWTPSPRNPRYHAKVTTDPSSLKRIGPSSIPKLGPYRDHGLTQVGRSEPRVSMKMPTLYSPRVVLLLFLSTSLRLPTADLY